MNLINKNIKDGRKIAITLAAGLLCLLFSGIGIEVSFEDVQVNVVWSVVFPLLVALAYGPRYAFLAALAGGAWFPFFLWANNGYANAANFLILTSLFVATGFLRPHRIKYKLNRFLIRLGLMMGLFSAFAAFMFLILFNYLLSFNPTPWTADTINHMERFVLTGFLVKDVVNYTFIILLAELMLHLPFIRSLLGLEHKPEFALNNKLFLYSILGGTIIWVSFVSLDYILFYTPAKLGYRYYLLALTIIIWSAVIVCRSLTGLVEGRLVSESYFKKKEKEFRTILESLHVGIGITDLKGKYNFVNSWWQHQLGYTHEEMQEITNLDVTHPEDVEVTKNKFNDLINRNIDVYNLEKRYIRKDGSFFWGQLYVSAVLHEDEPVKFVSGVINDITEKKQAEELLLTTQARQEAMIANITDVIAILDLQGINLYKSPNVERIFGWKPGELIGKSCSENIHPDHLEDARRFFEYILESANRSGVLEVRYKTKSGEYKWIEVSAVNCIDSPEIAGILVNYRDISERKKTLALEQEVAVAHKSVEFKQKFLANMSHEIRTPLTGVLGMADILAQTHLDNTQRDYLNTLIQSGDNLKEIINLILDYSKIEAGKLKIKASDFLIHDLLAEASKYFTSVCFKPIEWQMSIDEKVPRAIRADKSRLNQVIRNLISNAVKFTDAGSVKLSLFPVSNDLSEVRDRKEPVTIRVEVKDTGKGIPFPLQERLFEPFFQVENEYSRNVDGTGLGLPICKELVDMLGGEMGFESTPGKGSTFWFTFTCGGLEEKSLKNSAVQNHKTGLMPVPMKVLLVEDKLINRKVIRLMLQSLGHEVIFAHNGQKAIEIFKPGMFDLILMDIQMPVLDGVAATKLLREMHSTLPPIIGLSANAFEGDREKYMSLGLDEYLTKPVNSDDLRRLLTEIKMGN